MTALRLTLTAALCLAGPALAQDKIDSVSMLLPGKIDDGGFMQAGYSGLKRLETTFQIRTDYIADVPPQTDKLVEALRKLAKAGPGLVIAHGGQNGEAAKIVAAEFPSIPFVVVQGNVTGPNLSSYEVLQEDSAFLAGAAAGLLTKTGTVGHISGIRVPPGLKGRGGFYNGLMHTRPDAKFVTMFMGNQDDPALARRAAEAEMAAGADIIFTMLNAGRQGATEAMNGKARQIGNVIDWTQKDPKVFVGSAVADASIPSLEAFQDLRMGVWKPGVIRHIGLENPQAVSLALAPDVPQDVRQKVDALRQQIISGAVKVSTEYSGEEMSLPGTEAKTAPAATGMQAPATSPEAAAPAASTGPVVSEPAPVGPATPG